MNEAFEDGAAAADKLTSYLQQQGQGRLLDYLDKNGFEKFGTVVRASLADRLLLSADARKRHEASARARQELPAAIRDMLEKGARRDEANRALDQAEAAAAAERRAEEAAERAKARAADPTTDPDLTEDANGKRAVRRPRDPSAPISRGRNIGERVMDWSKNFAERKMQERGIDAEELRRQQLEREQARAQDKSPSPSRGD